MSTPTQTTDYFTLAATVAGTAACTLMAAAAYSRITGGCKKRQGGKVAAATPVPNTVPTEEEVKALPEAYLNQKLFNCYRQAARLGIIERAAAFDQTWNEDKLDRFLARVVSRDLRTTGPTWILEKTGQPVTMFGANDYLGLTHRPEVSEAVIRAVEQYGTGLGGPPLYHGTTAVHAELIKELAEWKGFEHALLTSSGFSANMAWVTALVTEGDLLLLDEHIHGSVRAGAPKNAQYFLHNNIDSLKEHLEAAKAFGKWSSVFVCVEAVYSMAGDIAPLPEIVAVCKAYGAHVVVDEAHSTGVLGDGAGAIHHFHIDPKDVLLDLVTFSKALASTGAALLGSRAVLELIRLFGRPYVLSTSMTPMHVAGVLGAVRVIRKDGKELCAKLHRNMAYLSSKLVPEYLPKPLESGIVVITIRSSIDASYVVEYFARHGVFISAVGWPAVPHTHQGMRVTISAEHTTEELDHLVALIKAFDLKYVAPPSKLAGQCPPSPKAFSNAPPSPRAFSYVNTPPPSPGAFGTPSSPHN
eukprot:TRINITY_DN1111_c0_g2_i1.p1 TRINITY_DN1111_c0_g2~~TRINITY_DN1111_c0_g2_i1.p1  ORF type:complete len:527 (-),score=152.73 TRINITY_DN1111_c0_g2_i1:106-1686(-)